MASHKKAANSSSRKAAKAQDVCTVNPPPLEKFLKEVEEDSEPKWKNNRHDESFNQIGIAMEILWGASDSGSDEAQDFLFLKAEEFIQMAGKIATPHKYDGDQRSGNEEIWDEVRNIVASANVKCARLGGEVVGCIYFDQENNPILIPGPTWGLREIAAMRATILPSINEFVEKANRIRR
jgi:hypothetical protein